MVTGGGSKGCLNATLSPIFMEMENGTVVKESSLGGTHVSLPCVWEEE